MSAMIVAIDGPAGSGKSSVSKDAARRLGFSYYDTGAAYRALAWAAMTAGIDLTDQDAVLALQERSDYRASEDPDNQTFVIDGEDVTQAIRGGDVSGAVSAIAQHTLVRAGLVDHFRKVLGSTCAWLLQSILSGGRGLFTPVLASKATSSHATVL